MDDNILEIAKKIENEGGRLYLVGGADTKNVKK